VRGAAKEELADLRVGQDACHVGECHHADKAVSVNDREATDLVVGHGKGVPQVIGRGR
jgi:hypothetical protein